MAKTIQSVKGMRDLLPEQTTQWQFLEHTLSTILTRYGYREIRTPILEMSDLFERSVGETSDIVEKEMYTFTDQGDDRLSLRPEGTASTVRAGIEQGLLYNQQQRLWYMGPMFRRERPQKGRYRQFHQIGAETFGMAGPDIDAELIAMTARFWDALGLKNIRLELNSLGTPESRAAYRHTLVEYFTAHAAQLDADSQRRLHKNPLRILDSKNPAMQDLIAAAPSLHDHLDDESQQHFAKLCNLLDTLGISYTLNPRLVRGLDYYTHTVFEWITDELGSQGTVCAGGRYDGLVSQLGGHATTGCGFAMGLERLLELREAQQLQAAPFQPDIYLILAGGAAVPSGLQLAEQLRSALPQLTIQANVGGGSFKAQMKRADKSGAAYSLILGEDELAAGQIGLKAMQGQFEGQRSLSLDNELAQHLLAAIQA